MVHLGPGIPFAKEVVCTDFPLREGDWVHYQMETLVNRDGVRTLEVEGDG